jgi:hypothetical protein
MRYFSNYKKSKRTGSEKRGLLKKSPTFQHIGTLLIAGRGKKNQVPTLKKNRLILIRWFLS